MRLLKQIICWAFIVVITPIPIIGILLVGLSIPALMFLYAVIDPSEAEWSA